MTDAENRRSTQQYADREYARLERQSKRGEAFRVKVQQMFVDERGEKHIVRIVLSKGQVPDD